jgi:hypothetical protein
MGDVDAVGCLARSISPVPTSPSRVSARLANPAEAGDFVMEIDDGAAARGEALHQELGRLGVAPESLQRELDPDTAAKVLAWMRGEGPCPSID